tara:strand:- start:5210 stop:5413 length:204 start_codon:yes stop_codon:yes gene_type:complete
MKRKSPANNARELIATLSDPKYLNMYRAFNKMIDRANDPAFKKIWTSKRGQVARLADQCLLEETKNA